MSGIVALFLFEMMIQNSINLQVKSGCWRSPLSIRKWCHLHWMPKGHPQELAGKVIYSSKRTFKSFLILRIVFNTYLHLGEIFPNLGMLWKGCCFLPKWNGANEIRKHKGTLRIGGTECKGVNAYISRAPGLLTSFTLGYIIGWTPSFHYHTRVFDPVVGRLWPCVSAGGKWFYTIYTCV